MNDAPTNLVTLRDKRDRAIEILGTHYANDVLALDEYERRVEAAERATTIEAIERLVADLEPLEGPAPQTTAIARASQLTIVPADQLPHRRSAVSVLSSVSRKGPWTVPRRLKVTAVLGSVELDFREAKLSEGTTRIDVTCVLGEVKIVVPPELRVDLEGTGVLGEFEQGDENDSKVAHNPKAPKLLVHGVAVLGEVQVSSRLAGESWWEAWKRRRRERKERKRLARQDRKQLPPGS